MKRLKQVDFSGFTREEAIARLEMVQAVLTRSIDTGEQHERKEHVEHDENWHRHPRT